MNQLELLERQRDALRFFQRAESERFDEEETWRQSRLQATLKDIDAKKEKTLRLLKTVQATREEIALLQQVHSLHLTLYGLHPNLFDKPELLERSDQIPDVELENATNLVLDTASKWKLVVNGWFKYRAENRGLWELVAKFFGK